MKDNNDTIAEFRRKTNRPDVNADVPANILHDFNRLTAPISNLIGNDGLESVLDTLFKISRGNFPYFLKRIENTAHIVEQLFEQGKKELVANVVALTGKLSDIHPSPAIALLNTSPEIIKRIHLEGLESISNLSGKIALFSWDSAKRFIETIPFLIDAVLKKTSPQILSHICLLASTVSDKHWKAALNLFDHAPEIIDRISAVGNDDLLNNIYALANQIATKYPQLAVSLSENSPDIIERIGYPDFHTIFNSIFSVASVNEASAVRLLDGSAGIIDHLLKQGDTKTVLAVYDLVSQTAEADDTLALKLWEKGPVWIESAGLGILEKITGLCFKIAGSSRHAALAFMETGPELIKRIGIDGLEKSAALFSELGKVSDRVAEQLCRKSPDIIDNVSYEGLKDIADFCAYLSKDSPSLTQEVIQNQPAWINRLLTTTDHQHIRNIYRLLSRMAEDNPRIAIAMMEHIPDLLARITVEQLEELSSLSLQTARQSWTTAVSFIKIAPAIIDRIGFEMLPGIAGLGSILSEKNVYTAVSILDKIPSVIDSLVKYTTPETALAVFDLISDIAILDTEAFGSLLEKSPDLIKHAGISGVKRIIQLSRTIAGKHPDVAAQFVKSSPEIMELLDLSSLEVLSEYFEKIAEHHPETAIHILRESPGIVARLLESVDQNSVLNICQLLSTIADTKWEISASLFEKSPDVLEASGFEGLEMIARQALILDGINSKKAIQFARGESVEFSDFMETLPQGLRLRHVKPVLSNYLMALSGRRIDIEEGEKANTDGRKIILPGRIRELQEDDDNFIFYKVMATHQEAHLEYGSFEFEITEGNDLIQTVKTAYKMDPPIQGSDLERFCQLFPEPLLINDLIHMAEDYRVETKLKKEYPVLGDHILFVHKHNLKKKPSVQKIKNQKQKCFEIIRQDLFAHLSVNDLSEHDLHILKIAQSEARFLDSAQATVNDSVRAATHIYIALDQTFGDSYKPARKTSESLNQSQVLKNIGSFGKTSKQIFEQLNPSQTPNKSQPDDNRSQEKTEPSSGSSPSRTIPDSDKIMALGAQKTMSRRSVESDDPDGHQGHGSGNERYEKQSTSSKPMKYSSIARVEKLLKNLFKEKGITPAEIEKKIKHMTPDQVELFLNRMETTIPTKEELEKETGTRLYPEWGNDISGYRNNWARIREQKIAGVSKDFYMETMHEYAGLLKKVRREFQLMKPEESERMKKQFDGDEIDLDAAIEYVIDHKIGLSPSEKNYQRIVKKKRDMATLMLIDMSKSTKGATIHCEKQALVIMSEALKEVGDAFAIYGFSGDNRDNVDFYQIKGFDEPYNQEIMRRISAIDHRFENRDGTALRHAVTMIKNREEKTKLIILLSDGKPVDKEYSGNYAIEDTRMALMEARKNGIHTFCVTVDKNASEYLPRMYSHSNWAVINDVNKLPEKMYGIYSRLTH